MSKNTISKCITLVIVIHLYNIFVKLIDEVFLQIFSIFNNRINNFRKNRISLLNKIKNELKDYRNNVWFHAASLGEYEIAVPLIRKIKKKYNCKIILTFFSESGFKLESRIGEIDKTFYFPIDTKENAQKFLDTVKPKMTFFIKSELWPNFLIELKKRKIRSYLVESKFEKNNKYLNGILGNFFINKLRIFNKIFTIDKESEEILKKKKINNVIVSGSLKIERAKELVKSKYANKVIEEFIGNDYCIVCGSTWEIDEKIIFNFIKKYKKKELKWVIAPHNTSKNNIKRIINTLNEKHLLYSKNKIRNAQCNVLIIDTIGHLKNIYKYSTISYVGGGMGNTGLHNILEACVHSVPVVIGKKYKKFKESIDLVNSKGIVSVKNQFEFDYEIEKLIDNIEYRTKKVNIIRKYLESQTYATDNIIKYL